MGRGRQAGDDVWTFSKPGQKVQWPYDRWYRARIARRCRYTFVRQHWDRRVADIERMEHLKLEGPDPIAPRLSDADRAVFRRVRQSGVKTLMAFLDRVASREAAQAFCDRAAVDPRGLMCVLRKADRYLPLGCQMRQLVDPEDRVYRYVDRLVASKLGYSLELLERGRTAAGRRRLAEETGIPTGPLLDLVRRADLTRLHLVSGGMVRASWAVGCKGLAALKQTTGEEFYLRTRAHYEKAAGGKPFDLTRKTAEGHIRRLHQAIDILEE